MPEPTMIATKPGTSTAGVAIDLFRWECTHETCKMRGVWLERRDRAERNGAAHDRAYHSGSTDAAFGSGAGC